MRPAPTAELLEANQRGLVAALAEVARRLERHARARGEERAAMAAESTEAEAPAAPTGDLPAEPDAPSEAYALDSLCGAFGLSSFERAVLLLCAGMELDSSFAARCAAAQGDARRAYPTFGLALAALPDPHWSALGPQAPLRRFKLVEIGGGDLLAHSPLRIDERVLHYLAGVPYLDERLQGLAEHVHPPDVLPPSQDAIAGRITAVWASAPNGLTSGWAAIQLVGESSPAKRAVAARACAAAGFALHAVRSVDVPPGPAEQEALLRLWSRESVLARSALFLDADEMEAAERPRLLALLERVGGPVLVSVREPLGGLRRLEVRLEVRRPQPEEQRAAWHRCLGPWSSRLNGQVDTLVAHFSLNVEAIRSVCAATAGAAAADELSADGLGDRLWSACREQARSRLDELAHRIESRAGFDDLVLPQPQRELLNEIAGQVRQRRRVYDGWGFGTPGARGLGISALFAGPSGTGKTMAAEVLARELRLDLYRIDLSQVVSKYIGETEKNLRRVFDAAEGGGAILLFDEADALFGKRSEVKDSHDRYANIEVSYLLQRMEEYSGLAILTTNLKGALDPAFLRRLRFVVSFPFPDTAQREEIWRRVFPPETPTEGLDPLRLARLSVAGGNIRNIALHAAFLAAEAGVPVRMGHVLRAARGEYAKLEKTLTESEIVGWV
jgi:ATPase family associated with various cellular activities (AAA)/Winged helix domain, variant